MLKEYIDEALVVLFVAFVFTQCFLPTIRGQHWFPIFRRKRRTLLQQLEEEKTVIEDEKIEEELKALKLRREHANANESPDREADTNSSHDDRRTDTTI